MENNEEAYRIIITPIISHETFNHIKKVEAIQTKTMTFFRYISASLYRDYEAIDDERFFLDEDKAIAYWNQAISRDYSMLVPAKYLEATA
ncbi:MAG: hypothetical protein ACXAEX_20945 [Promethearchaeota archaeon]|jgi:hypothetical protein